MRRIYLSNKKLISRIYETNNRGLANIRFQPGIYWPDWWFFIEHACWLIFIDSDGWCVKAFQVLTLCNFSID